MPLHARRPALFAVNPAALRPGDIRRAARFLNRPVLVFVAASPQNTGVDYKSNHNVTYSCKYYSCKYHVVWCPKYRRRVLIDKVATRLKQIISELADETRSDMIEMEVMPEHVQLLIEVDPQYGIHRFVKLVKGRSSHHLRPEFPWLKTKLPTLWTNAYLVSTAGGAPRSVVKQFIENQPKSQRQASVKTEIRKSNFRLPGQMGLFQ